MISLYNIVSANSQWLLERLDFYVSKAYCLKNAGFVNEKQKVVISEISDYICEAFSKNINTSEIASNNDKNKYRYTGNFINVLSGLGMDISRNNIIRLIKHCKKVYLELICNNNLSDKEERELCSFLEGFFDNFELNIFDNWYGLKNINELGNLNFEEFRDISFQIADITDDRQVKDELIRNSENLRTLIDAMTDYVCFKDDAGKWTEANETAIDLFDLGNIDYKGMTSLEMANTNKGFYRNIFNKCNTSDANTWNAGHAIVYEQIINKPDGRRYIYETMKVPLYYKNGTRKAIVVLGKNVTSRKEAEIKLMESEFRYRKLFDLFPDAIYIKRENKILLSNEKGIELLGKEKHDDIRGKEPDDFLEIQPDYESGIYKSFDEIYERSVFTASEGKFIRKSDGKSLDLYITCSLFPYEGDNTMLVIARDITEMKKTEILKNEMSQKDKQLLEAAEYDKIKNEFFANISHELRTPLNVILGTLQLFELMSKKDKLDYCEEKFIKYTMIMKQNCYRLVKTVNNLIDITEIDSGNFPIHMRNNNIIEIVENIVMSIIDYIDSKGISIQFDTDAEEKTIGCDSDIIERIMLNLLSNSIKFTQPGGKIKVSIFNKDSKVIITVRDTGIGVPEDKLSTIFERFVQVDRSLSRVNEGSGIGLSMVKSLAEMQGGTISVRSKLGQGSEFIVELPDRLIDESTIENIECFTEKSNEEKINVEFSDIYFN